MHYSIPACILLFLFNVIKGKIVEELLRLWQLAGKQVFVKGSLEKKWERRGKAEFKEIVV